ncbi:MAG: TrkH family potassium uptake protein [Chlamydiia bacterium]|nr:TrkH family potassium uptake protein [Chlamydiia bacterium]
MLYREISRILGSYLFFLACALCVPLLVSIYYQHFDAPQLHPQPHSTQAFVLSIVLCLGMAFGFRLAGRSAKGQLFRREALLLVVIIWFVTAAVGALPFYLSGTLSNPIDAYFEAMSGLTTTGASVMHPKNFDPYTGAEIPYTQIISTFYDIDYTFYGTIDPVLDPITGQPILTGIEAVGKGLLFWRSFMQWLGGMGIVVLFVAVLPALGVGGKMLYQAEVPGPAKDAVTPRIKETASWLWRVYLGFTIAEILLLRFFHPGLPYFDAACITFANLSTGGFTVTNSGIASYSSPAVEWIIIAFMLIGSTNFSLYFHCLRGRFFRLYEPEFITYYISVFLGCIFVVYHLLGSQITLLTGETLDVTTGEAVRHGCFHLISAQTSTGFACSNYDTWPWVNQVLMLIMMFVGSMAGSTGGGIKIMRHFLAFRIVQDRVIRIFRPETIRTFRVGQWEVDQNVAQTILSYYLIVIALSAVGTFILTLDNIDPETALGVNTCMINNIGMAFRMAAPTGSFAFLSPLAKVISILWMVLGRLEFFAVLVVLMPEFWRHK